MTKRIYAHKTFPPASDADIAAAEAKFGIKFLDDYKTFLKTDNGLIIEEPDPDDDYEDWINKATRIFGLNDDPYYSFGDSLNSILDPRYLEIFYSVGIDGGGNDLVQIVAGKRRGELAMMDHEVYGGMEDLLQVEDFEYPDHYEGQAKLAFNTFADATADQILDECFEHGFLAHYPITFGDQIKALDKLYNKIARKNKKRPKKVVQPKATISALRLHFYEAGESYPVEQLDEFYGSFAIVQSNEGLGWVFEIELEEDREIRSETTVTIDRTFVADQRISTVDSNVQYRNVIPVAKNGEPLPSGNYEILMTFPDDEALAPVKTSYQIVVGERQANCTTCLSFESATEAEITKFENKLPYKLCDDYRRYLANENGRHFFWPWIKLWNRAEESRDDERDAEARSLTDQGVWELGVSEIYGLQKPWVTFDEYSDPPNQLNVDRGLSEKIGPDDDWRQINPVLCPVADDRSGSMGGWYQIIAGKHRGKMARCKDNSFALDGIFQVKDFKRVEGRGEKSETKSYPFEDVSKATPDQLIDAYLADDLIEITDMDFTSFRDLVTARHETAFADMFDKYINEKST